jgi:hypothetical protein
MENRKDNLPKVPTTMTTMPVIFEHYDFETDRISLVQSQSPDIEQPSSENTPTMPLTCDTQEKGLPIGIVNYISEREEEPNEASEGEDNIAAAAAIILVQGMPTLPQQASDEDFQQEIQRLDDAWRDNRRAKGLPYTDRDYEHAYEHAISNPTLILKTIEKVREVSLPRRARAIYKFRNEGDNGDHYTYLLNLKNDLVRYIDTYAMPSEKEKQIRAAISECEEMLTFMGDLRGRNIHRAIRDIRAQDRQVYRTPLIYISLFNQECQELRRKEATQREQARQRAARHDRYNRPH